MPPRIGKMAIVNLIEQHIALEDEDRVMTFLL